MGIGTSRHRYAMVEYDSPGIESIDYHPHYGKLSHSIYTMPYPSSQRKRDTIFHCCNYKDNNHFYADLCISFIVIIILMIPSLLAIGAVVGAINIIEFNNSLNIAAQCQLIQQLETSYWKIIDKNAICPDGNINVYDYNERSTTDIVSCWTNTNCDAIIVNNNIFMLPGNDKYPESFVYIAVFVIILIAVSCGACSCFYCIPKYELDYTEKVCKLRACCKYFNGEDKLNYFEQEWLNMDINAQFDYYISYYGRKYNIDLGNDVTDLLYEFVKLDDHDDGEYNMEDISDANNNGSNINEDYISLIMREMRAKIHLYTVNIKYP